MEPVLFFLLLGFQHSESVFHVVVKDLPDALRTLRSEADGAADPVNAPAAVTLARLGEAAHFLMSRFPGFPELYDPLTEALSEMGVAPPSTARSEDLKTLSWLSPIHSSTFADSRALTARQRRGSSSLVDNALVYRSETGMVGLINLGNTCYMNSVLQALFISQDFTEGVLQSLLTSQQAVLFRLQQVFAFLRLSQRNIYSPSEFLKTARPPWFEPGRQQDCSEFLRYLLDTLHEQEKTAAGARAIGSYGEHKVIESSSAPTTSAESEDTRSCASSLTFSAPAAVASAATTMSSVSSVSARISSSSNLALDVISEAPENSDEEGRAEARNEEDEEMLSQVH